MACRERGDSPTKTQVGHTVLEDRACPISVLISQVLALWLFLGAALCHSSDGFVGYVLLCTPQVTPPTIVLWIGFLPDLSWVSRI